MQLNVMAVAIKSFDYTINNSIKFNKNQDSLKMVNTIYIAKCYKLTNLYTFRLFFFNKIAQPRQLQLKHTAANNEK